MTVIVNVARNPRIDAAQTTTWLLSSSSSVVPEGWESLDFYGRRLLRDPAKVDVLVVTVAGNARLDAIAGASGFHQVDRHDGATLWVRETAP